jgi:hypothetical protein
MGAPVPVKIRCGLDAALIGADESWIGHEIVVVDTAQALLIVESVFGNRMRAATGLPQAGTGLHHLMDRVQQCPWRRGVNTDPEIRLPDGI